jgi:IclR family acetate operon transcriptional repressor
VDETVRGKLASVKSERSERHSIQSVDRAITLLEAIAEAGGECSLTELSHRTQLNISTCHHLLSTLVQRGYVAKVPVRRTYALGAHSLSLQRLNAGRSPDPRRTVHRADQ